MSFSNNSLFYTQVHISLTNKTINILQIIQKRLEEKQFAWDSLNIDYSSDLKTAQNWFKILSTLNHIPTNSSWIIIILSLRNLNKTLIFVVLYYIIFIYLFFYLFCSFSMSIILLNKILCRNFTFCNCLVNFCINFCILIKSLVNFCIILSKFKLSISLTKFRWRKFVY